MNRISLLLGNGAQKAMMGMERLGCISSHTKESPSVLCVKSSASQGKKAYVKCPKG